MPFLVLDPTEQPAPEVTKATAAAPAVLTTLRGARVGLLGNNKFNADNLLDAVGRLLERDHGAIVTQRENKRDASRPVPTAILERFDGNVDLVITAIGD